MNILNFQVFIIFSTRQPVPDVHATRFHHHHKSNYLSIMLVSCRCNQPNFYCLIVWTRSQRIIVQPFQCINRWWIFWICSNKSPFWWKWYSPYFNCFITRTCCNIICIKGRLFYSIDNIRVSLNWIKKRRIIVYFYLTIWITSDNFGLLALFVIWKKVDYPLLIHVRYIEKTM